MGDCRLCGRVICYRCSVMQPISKVVAQPIRICVECRDVDPLAIEASIPPLARPSTSNTSSPRLKKAPLFPDLGRPWAHPKLPSLLLDVRTRMLGCRNSAHRRRDRAHTTFPDSACDIGQSAKPEFNRIERHSADNQSEIQHRRPESTTLAAMSRAGQLEPAIPNAVGPPTRKSSAQKSPYSFIS